MSLVQIYKGNKGLKGHACSFSFSTGEKKGIYVELIKQTGWDPKGNNGKGLASFKGGDKVVVKFSEIEAAGLVRVFEIGKFKKIGEKKFFHSNNTGNTQISLKDYEIKGERVGYSFSINQNKDGEKNSYYIAFTFDEAALIERMLILGVDKIMLSHYAANKKKYQEANKSQ